MVEYTKATVIDTEGARIGIVTCLSCGAAVMLDPRTTTDAIELHNNKHQNDNRVADDARWGGMNRPIGKY